MKVSLVLKMYNHMFSTCDYIGASILLLWLHFLADTVLCAGEEAFSILHDEIKNKIVQVLLFYKNKTILDLPILYLNLINTWYCFSKKAVSEVANMRWHNKKVLNSRSGQHTPSLIATSES